MGMGELSLGVNGPPEKEWNGPWSDGSAEWERVTYAQKHRLGITVEEDGEFWMPWDQFIKFFTDISVCQLFNTTACKLPMPLNIANGEVMPQQPIVYHEYIFYDKWTSNGVRIGAPKDRAGGCQNFPATFCFNPQYSFDVTKDNAEIMIALTQKDTLLNEQSKKRDPFCTIGVHVMRVECNRRYRIHQPINPVGTSDYASARSVYLHLTGLKQGRYILMPTTFAPREKTDFMLRVYSQQELRMRILVEDAPGGGIINCARASYSVTRVRVEKALLGIDKDLLIYCVVHNGHGKARSHSGRATCGKVTFDEMFLFYVSDAQQNFKFELWEERTLADKCLARCSLTILSDNESIASELDLMMNNAKEKTVYGKLAVEISSYDDPIYL